MWRLGQAGWECWYVPEARILHEEGAATEIRSADRARRRRPDYWYESRRLFLLKTGSRGRAVLGALTVTGGALLNHLISALRRQPPRLPLHFLADHTRLVLRPLLRGRA